LHKLQNGANLGIAFAHACATGRDQGTQAFHPHIAATILACPNEPPRTNRQSLYTLSGFARC